MDVLVGVVVVEGVVVEEEEGVVVGVGVDIGVAVEGVVVDVLVGTGLGAGVGTGVGTVVETEPIPAACRNNPNDK